MKKIFVITACLILLACASEAVKLTRVRFGYFPDKIRAVLEFDAPFTYNLEESKEKIILHLPKTEAGPEIPNYVEISDVIIRYFEVEKMDDELKVSIPLGEPIPYNIFSLNDPARLAIDFDREFTNVVSGGTIIDGVESLSVSKGTQYGRVSAQVLKIDLNKADVYPALARKKKPNLLDSFVSVINPWKEADPDRHFYRARTSAIAEEQGAVAGINGTFFAGTGRPLGSLLINKELVSTPIYDRTTLVISDDHQAFIDNVSIDCYFNSSKNIRYDITGVNQGRDEGSIILYTPAWGEKTGTGNDGIELVTSGAVVKEIRTGNSNIPSDGYVISISGPAAQFVTDNVKVGDRIDFHIKVVPFATSPGSILHMISGGPRLVKEGIVYVSKHEEKFKSDIALGRAARTAVGVNKDGKLLLVTVDGLPRKKESRGEKSSIGVTLEELAELMINLGATDAMNLDGGGSTTMWIDGRIVNHPASGYEQVVSNALLISPRSD